MVFYALCVTFGLLVLLDGAGPYPALSRTKADSNRLQLRELAGRLTPGGPALANGSLLVLGYSSPCGGYHGVAANLERSTNLYFSLDVRPAFFPNPQRPEVPAMELLRNSLGSSLVRPGDRSKIGLTLHPGEDPADPSDAVTIDSVRGGSSHELAIGWGLGSASISHHCLFDPRDVRFFALLTRVLGVRANTTDPGAPPRVTIVTWREPVRHRIGFEVAVASGGKLSGYFQLRYRAETQTPASARWFLGGRQADLEVPLELLLIAPGEAGLEPLSLAFDPADPRDVELEVSFDLLLRGTSWRDEESLPPRFRVSPTAVPSPAP